MRHPPGKPVLLVGKGKRRRWFACLFDACLAASPGNAIMACHSHRTAYKPRLSVRAVVRKKARQRRER